MSDLLGARNGVQDPPRANHADREQCHGHDCQTRENTRRRGVDPAITTPSVGYADTVGGDIENPGEHHDDGKPQNHEHHHELKSPLGGEGGEHDLTELQHHEGDGRVAHGHPEHMAAPQLRHEGHQL